MIDIKIFIFLVVGDGIARNALEDLASNLGGLDQVIFTGKVGYEKIPDYIAACDVGILPFPGNLCWNVSSPIKLMEYLAMRKPVIATNIEAHRAVIEKTGGGIIIEDETPERIAESIAMFPDLNNVKTQLISTEEFKSIISWEFQAKALVPYISTVKLKDGIQYNKS